MCVNDLNYNAISHIELIPLNSLLYFLKENECLKKEVSRLSSSPSNFEWLSKKEVFEIRFVI